MSVRPTPIGHLPDGLMIDVRQKADHVVLRLAGRLSLRTVPRAREITVKSLLNSGRVVINVSGLRSSEAAFVAVFPAALAACGGWPSARLVLFGARAPLRSMLVSARITETVPLAADLASAVALLEERPPQVRRHLDLPAHYTAPSAARRLVREACDTWLLSSAVREITELVVTELVTNAVEHAYSSSQLILTLTRSALRVSVRDYCPAPIPRPRPIDINALRGRGLHLVTCLADTWRVEPQPDGKTIWVSLPLDPPE
jgi:anti-sigma regulatory factor (Ser/Thr protein kinase)/anti-anti-sigma regulatory factor